MVLMKRYAQTSVGPLLGAKQETPAGLFYRVAYHVAQGEPDEQRRGWRTQDYYHLLADLRFLPNSPTFTGAGTPLGQLAACFVIPLSDDMGREGDGIFSTLRVAALIQQTGGGNGFNFGRIRPAGDLVGSTGGRATGPVGFLQVYDKAFGEVAQGGSRRGANMGVMPVNHPDIEAFIDCKTKEGDIANFNVSVAVTDDFMNCVKHDREFPLVNPRDQKVWKMVNARGLFDKIVNNAHANGEPGLLFIDAANRANPVPHLYALEATNPCVTGDTLVSTPDGQRRVDEIKVGDLIHTSDNPGPVDRIEIYNHRPVCEVMFENGVKIRATMAHQFYVPVKHGTGRVPVALESLVVGSAVCTDGSQVAGATQYHYPLTKIKSIEFAGYATVYDLHEPVTDSWVTNGIYSRGCGEQWLGPYENCCLGSVNLAEHLLDERGEPARVDWALLRQTVCTATLFLDDVVTMNAYVPAVPELKQAALASRRIGLGIMGLADLLFAVGISYASSEGRELAAQVMEFVRYYAMETSIKLADTRGPFSAFAGSIYDNTLTGGMTWVAPTPRKKYVADFGRPPLDWTALTQDLIRFGIRNAAQTTIAPTGTLSTVAGCEGYGCEPAFALGYTRHFKDGDKDVELAYHSRLFTEALNRLNLPGATLDKIYAHVARTGSCQTLTELPESFRAIFMGSGDISPSDHVTMQATLQAFVDNSLSKTVNMPATATPQDVADAYWQAWVEDCKGITVYVTGSRQQVVLETKETTQNDASAPALPDDALERLRAEMATVKATLIERPRAALLQGFTYRKETPLGKAYVTVNSDMGGDPFEVFINVGKAGSEVSAVSEAFGRLLSLFLRTPSSLPPGARLAAMAQELKGIGGNRPFGFGPNRVASLPDGIAQVLFAHLDGIPAPLPSAGTDNPEGEFVEQPLSLGDLCPECGEGAFVNTEGCRKCLACGYSEC